MVVSLAACGGSEGVAAPLAVSSATTATTTHLTTTTAETHLGDEELIVAVVERFYEVVIEANNPPDPESDLWDDVAVPVAAGYLRARSVEKLEAGEGNRYPDPRRIQVLAPQIPILDGNAAVINICLRDDTVLHDLTTAEVLNDDVVFVWVQHRLTNTHRGWRVSATTNVQRFDEEAPCVASYQ